MNMKMVWVMVSACFIVVGMSIVASAETATLSNIVPICQKRDTALSATLTAAIALSEGKLSSDEISAAMEKAGCLYPQTTAVP